MLQYILIILLSTAVCIMLLVYDSRFNDLKDDLSMQKIKYDALKENFDEYRKGALKREEGYIDHFKNVTELLASLNNDFDTHKRHNEELEKFINEYRKNVEDHDDH